MGHDGINCADVKYLLNEMKCYAFFIANSCSILTKE